MKITKRQLRKLIKEEIAGGNTEAEMTPNEEVIAENALYAAIDALVALDYSANDIMEIVTSHPMGMKEGRKAPKTKKDPPYRERGSTESQAQQMAAGIALSARRGDTPVSKLKGASLEMYKDKGFTTKEIEDLATLGQKVRGHKSKEPKHRKSLPGHATPAKD